MKDLYAWNVHPEDDVRTERDMVKRTELELEQDQIIVQQVMNKYPVVGNEIIKLRCENGELKQRIRQLEREVLALQHERIPFHDLGQ